MKKNVIALAVAAAMVAPAAMAEVKVSGGLQAQLVNYSGDGVNEGWYATDGGEMARENSGNYGFLKFSASEDLGNGMKAMAVYNMNVSVGDADGVGSNGGPGGREAYLGLAGNFGAVLAGTLSNPYKSATVKWDPFLGTFAQARGSYGASTLHNSYVGNAVAYANKFGMAKVVAAVVLDETPNVGTNAGNTTAQHAKALSVNMPVGPVEVALGYVDLSNFNGSAGSAATSYGDDADAMKLGVKYTAGAITASLQHETLGDGLGDQTFLLANASYTSGANKFSLGFGQNDDGTDTNGYMALGVKHSFSKKVSATVAYRNSDDASNTDADVSAFGAGLRMAF